MVGDGREPHRRRHWRHVLDQEDPAAAAGDDDADLCVAVTELREQRLQLALDGVARHGELDRGGGALEPVEVIG